MPFISANIISSSGCDADGYLNEQKGGSLPYIPCLQLVCPSRRLGTEWQRPNIADSRSFNYCPRK